MNRCSPLPELSIIVPILNEEETLPVLLASLAAQCGADFELILCDGGSADRTLELCRQARLQYSFPIRIITTPRGRAAQMNAGAALAVAELLLFLHADSRLSAPSALAAGLAAWRAAHRQAGRNCLAGHFRLVFDGPGADHSAYYFYACKARSERPGTIHGDQGFLLSAACFRRLGGFPEDLPVLEDTRLADRLLTEGGWLLLPAEILTSTRRFHREGLLSRQVLNALVMNFAAIGWEAFFGQASGLYRQQAAAGSLDLGAFLEMIRSLLDQLPTTERRRLWQLTGSYVRSQGWQLALALDCRNNYRAGLPPGDGSTFWRTIFDRWYDRLSDNSAGRWLATTMVYTWFVLTRRRLARRQRKEAPCPR
jgi:rSAM/selenodomain-associated transferase 2